MIAAADVGNIETSACQLHGSLKDIMSSLCGDRTCRDQILDNLQQTLSQSEYDKSFDDYYNFCEEAGIPWEHDDDDSNMRFVDELTQNSPLKASLANLMEYGCWCNVASAFKKGRGSPVNELDAVCRNVNLNTQCIAIDGAEEDYVCNSNEIDYYPALRMSTDSGELETQCQLVNSLLYNKNANPKEKACAVRTCVVATYLVSALLEFSTSVGYSFEEEFIHKGRSYIAGRDSNGQDIIKEGTFDFKKKCKALDYDDSPKKCCGLYPYRHYYQSDVKECCVSAEGEYGREVYSIKRCGQCDPRGAHYESDSDCTVMI